MEDENVERRGRGRPKGVKNTVTAGKAIMQQTTALYKDIEHMLTPEQRTYYEMAFKGKAEFDSVLEAELFLRFFSVYMTKKLSEQINGGEGLLKDFAAILGQYNTALKTLEDMRTKRIEMDAKKNNGNNGGVADSSRESALGRLKGVLREYPAESAG